MLLLLLLLLYCCFTGKLEKKSLEYWAAAERSAAPRLFLVDYWAVYDLLDILEKVNLGSNRVMHAGRCVLFRCVWGNVHGVCVCVRAADALLTKVVGVGFLRVG
jgi:hypothetical protein